MQFCSEKTRSMAGMATGAFGALIMGILFFSSLSFVENEVAMFGARGWFALVFPVFFATATFRYVATVVYGYHTLP